MKSKLRSIFGVAALGIIMLISGYIFWYSEDKKIEKIDYTSYPYYKDMMDDYSVNFYEVVSAGNAYFEGREKGRSYQKFQRWIGMNEDLFYPSGERENFNPMMPYEVRGMYEIGNVEPSEKPTFMNASLQTIGDANWEEMGPSVELKTPYSEKRNGNGRVDAMWINPNDANHIYVGNRGGGFWVTKDGGASWDPKTDFLGINGVNSIAVNPDNTNEVYIATAIGGGFSIGVFKSEDGGDNWAPTGYTLDIAQDLTRIWKVILNPSNPEILFAATSKGLIKTNDGFQTYSKVLEGDIVDVELKPGDGAIVYAINDDDSTLYKSTDDGDNFLNTSIVAPGNNQIAVTPAAPSNVYMIGDNTFLKSTDEGSSFVQGGSPDGNSRNYGGFGVSDTDPDLIINGSLDTWLSSDGGTSFSEVTNWIYDQSTGVGGNFVHADIREVEVVNGVIYLGTDGWLVKSTDGGYNYEILTSNMGNHEIYEHGLGVSQAAPNTLIVGVQDNGTSILYEGEWHHWKGGDGGTSVADYSNKDIFYGSLYNGDFKRTETAGKTNTWYDLSDTKPGSLPPLIQHPTEPETLFLGEDDGEIWKSMDKGNSWTVISNLGVTDVVDELVVAPSNAQILYTSVKNQLWRSEDGGNNWVEVTNGLPNLVIKGIAIDYDDPDHIAITYSGFTDGEKAYESFNAGGEWSNISEGLPNLPNHDILFENSEVDGMYLASEVGVYFRDRNSENWSLYAEGLPNSRVNDMEIQHATGKLYVATWGRGVWKVDLMNPNLIPLTDFSVSTTKISKGETVDYTDVSLNSPTSWDWSFPGGDPSTSSVQNPSVTYELPGLYPVTLTTTNANGSSTQQKSDLINVTGDANQAEELEIYYPFDNSTADYSNYGRHGSLNGDDIYETGVKGNAFTFDGSNTISTFNFKGISGSKSRSIALWLKATEDGSLANWGTTGTAKRFTFRLDGGKLRVEIAGSYVIGSAVVTDGEWHHVAFTFEDDATPNLQNIKFYVNGNSDAVSAIGNAVNVNTGDGDNVILGNYPFGSNLQGAMDEFRIYSKVLTPDEISKLADPKIDGLVSRYEFDTDLADLGSNEIEATANYSPVVYTTNRSNLPNLALQSSGNSSDYLRIPNYKGVLGNNARSVTAWVKTTDAGSRKTIVSWGNNASGKMFNVMIANNNVRVEGGSSSIWSIDAELEDDSWHHIAYVFDSTIDNGSLASGKIYIDGKLQNTSNFNGAVLLNTSEESDVLIGAAVYNAAFFFQGSLDDVRIYDRAISESEILLMAGSNFEGQVFNYEFDGNLSDSGTSGIVAEANYQALKYTQDRVKNPDAALQTAAVSDSYLRIPGFKGIEGDGARTLAAWIKTSSEGTRKTIMSWGANAAGQMLNLMVSDGNVRVEGGFSNLESVEASIEDNNWHHIAYTFDPVNGSSLGDGKIYIDGVLQTNTTGYNQNNYDMNTASNLDVRIGDTQYNPDYFFRGDLDEVTLFNTALSDSEIIELMGELPALAPEFPLSAHYLFEGNLVDQSNYERDAFTAGAEEFIKGPNDAGQAYYLNGTNPLSIPGFLGEDGDIDRSIAAWIKTDSKGTSIVNYGTPVGGQKISFKSHSNGNLRLEVAGGYIVGSTNIADNRWHHVAFTFKKDDTPNVTDVVLYVDGQIDPISLSLDKAINTVGLNDVQIGTDSFSGNMEGAIDDLRIYSIALSAEEIQQFAKLPASGLVSNYTFLGNLEDDGNNNITAISGFGNITYTTDKLGLEASAWQTPESTGQFLTIPEYKGVTGNSARTISAWVKPETTGTRKTIVSWGENTEGGMFNLMVSGGEVRVEAGSCNLSSVGANLEDGNWHFVTYTFDPSVGTGSVQDGTIYVDGAPVSETSNYRGNVVINTSYAEDVRIGDAAYNANYFFRGDLDDIKIYDYALTSKEIQTEFCKVSSPIELELSQENKKVYYGYTDEFACTSLSVESLTGGYGDLYFEWDNGSTEEVITVCPLETTIYTVTAWDEFNCQSISAEIIVEVEDVRCGKFNEKIVVCHNGEKAICISFSDVADHLSHGDSLGSCFENQEIRDASIFSYYVQDRRVKVAATHQSLGIAHIFNLQGQLMDDFGFDENGANSKTLKKGIYILRVNIQDSMESIKFFID